MTSRTDDSLTLTGSRPASVIDRPGSSAAVRSNVYHCIGTSSAVDKTVFGSTQSPQSQNVEVFSSSKTTSKPLLWSPAPASHIDSPRHSPGIQHGMPNSRNKYRLVKHINSYCDEMLFGPPPEEPSFEAPWNKPDTRPKPLVGVDYSVRPDHTSATSARPSSSRRGAQSRSAISNRNSSKSNSPDKPLWR